MLSTEAKVGSVTIVGLLLLAYMIMHLSAFSFGEKGYPVTANFNHVNGLKEGNAVRYAGVDVGRVHKMEIVPQGIKVILMINPGTKIPEGSRFIIGTDGLLGEKYIDIVPPAAKTTTYLHKGAIVQGEDPQGLDHLIASADKVMAELNKLILSWNDVMGDPAVRQAIKDTAFNAKAITDNLNQFSLVLARMAENNEADINTVVTNLKLMSGSLRDVAARVDSLVTNVDNNGKTAADLKDTIQNLKTTSVRIEKMAASLEGVVTDPSTAQNIKETLNNAREVTEKANKMLTKVGSISAAPSFEMLYNPDNSKYRTNADVRINTSPEDFAVIGVTDIGNDSKFNFQIGKGSETFAGRAGVIDGKAGIGLDTGVRDGMRFSVDVYDPNAVKVKLRTQVPLSKDNYLIGQTDSINKDAEKNTYIGIRRSF